MNREKELKILSVFMGVFIGIFICFIGATTDLNYLWLLVIAIIIGAITGIALRPVFKALSQNN